MTKGMLKWQPWSQTGEFERAWIKQGTKERIGEGFNMDRNLDNFAPCEIKLKRRSESLGYMVNNKKCN